MIQRIHDKLNNNQRFGPIKVDGTLIMDGHHRFVALSLLGINVEIVGATKNHSTIYYQWNEVEIVHECDWDRPYKGVCI